jgi:hypothetical protein
MGESKAVDAVRLAVAVLNGGDVDRYLGYFEPSCKRWVAGFEQPLTLADIGDGLPVSSTPRLRACTTVDTVALTPSKTPNCHSGLRETLCDRAPRASPRDAGQPVQPEGDGSSLRLNQVEIRRREA